MTEIIPTLTPVASSNILAVGYDPASETLYVAFRPDQRRPAPALYAYDGVSADVPTLLWDVYRRGGSVGSAFGEYVKRAGFPYRRLPDLTPDDHRALLGAAL